MFIAGREIGNKVPPYVVAEISGNHCGDIALAHRLIKAAKDAGANAVKFQAYEPEDLTIDCDRPDFIIKDGLWKGRKLYELYQKVHTPFEWFPRLFEEGKRYEITVFASVFSKRGVDMLEKLGCPAYKIASMEIVDIPLIEYAASTGKPIIISSGMASEDEILDALISARVANGDRQNAVHLYCVSGYPTPIAEANLCNPKKHYAFMWGISDHTLGWGIPVAATALGAKIIEKHIMLNDTQPEDLEFSLTPSEFAEMVERVHDIWNAMQPSQRKSEQASRQLRRSLYVVKDVRRGEAFTEENVRSIRPSYGMPPRKLPEVLKSFAACDISRGTALEEGLLMPF